MIVYIIVDETPDTTISIQSSIVAVYTSKQKAMKHINKLKEKDTYVNQYLDIKCIKVKE